MKLEDLFEREEQEKEFEKITLTLKDGTQKEYKEFIGIVFEEGSHSNIINLFAQERMMISSIELRGMIKDIDRHIISQMPKDLQNLFNIIK